MRLWPEAEMILTGIYWHSPNDAAVLGAYLHGLAADIALPETGHQSFIASDIINIWEKHF
jgi:NAD(P)H-hydrate repair Nnr-like enzyme with NAD(P)H-hydrate dehydratase domain